ncbi:MAG TPA: hypothetical protein VGH02_15340, partial [Rhizomicrobium sp.]
LDFYAIDTDFLPILGQVFKNYGCRVFESYSEFDQEIREFKEPEDIIASRKSSQSIYLQLVVPSASELVQIRRIALNESTGHGFRYCIDGWGLIQLYLGTQTSSGITHSHTNHNSEVRARTWETTIREMKPASSWNWKEINRISSALNRFIRKQAVATAFRRPVLPAASRAHDAGADFLGVAPASPSTK